MFRRIERTTLFAVSLIAILLMVSCSGCEDPIEPRIEPIVYGPPFGQIAFINNLKMLGTIEVLADSEYVAYVPNIGQNSSFNTPGFMSLWTPEVSVNEMLLQDSLSNSLYIVDEQGISSLISERVLPGSYTYSKSGSRVAYIRVTTGGDYELVYRVVANGEEEVIETATNPYKFSGRVGLGVPHDKILVCKENSTNDTLNKIAIYDDMELESNITTAGYNPQFNYNGSLVAWLNIEDGKDACGKIVIADADNLSVIKEIDFSAYGVGATSFEWSPAQDATEIALFTNLNANARLIVIDTDDNSIDELIVTDNIAYGEYEYSSLAAPSWYENGERLVLQTVLDSVYKVVSIGLDGSEIEEFTGGMSKCRPTWVYDN